MQPVIAAARIGRPLGGGRTPGAFSIPGNTGRKNTRQKEYKKIRTSVPMAFYVRNRTLHPGGILSVDVIRVLF
jgi:hypothetical protein